MKKNYFIFATLICLVFNTVVNGQDNALVSGNTDFLKQDNIINIVFSYDNMAVGKFRTEKEYIDKKVAEHNNAEPGKGDKWLAKWNEKKSNEFERIFIMYLNKKLKKIKIKTDRGLTNAKYTFYVKPYYLEEGWGVVVSSLASEVRMQIFVCETADITKQVAEFRIIGGYYQGSGMLAFEDAGKVFGKLFLKLIK